MNCIKVYHEKLKSTESSSYDGDISKVNFNLNPEHIDEDMNGSVLSDSATLRGMSLI